MLDVTRAGISVGRFYRIGTLIETLLKGARVRFFQILFSAAFGGNSHAAVTLEIWSKFPPRLESENF